MKQYICEWDKKVAGIYEANSEDEARDMACERLCTHIDSCYDKAPDPSKISVNLYTPASIREKEQYRGPDLSKHTMIVHHDDGVYRHIEFSVNRSAIYRFYLTTWPGYLAFTGDMGDWMFLRLHDMFEFFRGDRVNHSYWAEKCVAGVTREFDEEGFKEAVIEYWSEGHEFDLEHVLASEYEQQFYERVYEETNCGEFHHQMFTFHFKWACDAIVWAIKEYDEYTSKRTANPVSDT